ncbi:LuxR family transcriptional regulator [Streptomyces sp. NPDC049970]|uniref:LuxR family transcriptional regulator n=1 Tax=Streptomyces sp. NPDC049970 TaxID=3155033 RepID=UPI00342204CB
MVRSGPGACPGEAVCIATTGAHDQQPTARRGNPPLVERERETAVLRELVRRTASGRAGLVVVKGPGGIGRTTLLRALAHEAQHRGLRVVETAGARVRTLRLGAPDAAGVDGQALARVGRSRASVGQVRVLPASPAVVVPPHGPLLTYRQVVGSATATRPTLLSIDDADRADLESVRVLVRMLRARHDRPVLLALGWRDGEESAAPLEWVTRSMSEVVRPRPLTGAGIGTVVRRLTDGTVDAGFQADCLSATSGIPSLVTGLVAGMRELGLPLTSAGLTAAGEHDIPVFGERARRLLHGQPPAAVSAAQAVAVLGEGTLTTAGAGLARLETSAFARSLRRLEAVGLARGSGPEAWSLAHPAVRAAVLRSTPPRTLTDLHGRAARLLHDSGASADDIAEHLLGAPAVARTPWARTVLREAAGAAMLHGAAEHAVELLRSCVTPGHEDACDPALVAELGVAESRVDPEACIGHLTSVLDRLTDPDLRLPALSALVGALTRTGRTGHAAALLAAQDNGSTAGRARLQLLEADMLMAATDSLGACSSLLETVSLRLDLPGASPEERALLAGRAFLATSRTERVSQALAAVNRVLCVATPITDSPVTLAAAAATLTYADRPADAAHVYQQLLEGTDTVPDRLRSGLLALDGEAAQRLGRLDDALRTTAEALGSTPGPRFTHHQALAVAVRLHALLDRGDVDAAEVLACAVPPDVIDDAWQWNEFLGARGRLRLVLEDPGAAVADLTECGRRQDLWQRANPAVSPWWYWAGHAHLAIGDRAEAGRLATRAEELARASGLPVALGTALELLASASDEPGRLQLFADAESTLEHGGAPLALARARVARGRALLRAGHTGEARTVLRLAWEESHTLGARALHDEAHGLLLSAGARPRRSAARRSGELTRSERQVARLAATGRTNLQIAEVLFVTRRTVEVHLTSVYRKLGLSGRKELRGALGRPRPAGDVLAKGGQEL